ncbi:MAG: lipid-A-disaccharide synthase [Bacteroidaceae bacterium]|nr:lipid-A-disaccharide synthase [Bacteroidaceae bacterium]
MKYFFIAGEPSGDLHARHLMDAIKEKDTEAEIRYWYRPELAYMGFVSVAMHLPEILRGMKECRDAIQEFSPDRLVLVDYPGFNLKIAAWFHKTFVDVHGSAATPPPQVVYYIPPKIWAWKEGRIAQIRKYVDKVLSILPFEVQWYAGRYDYHVDYVGNPTLDEIDLFRKDLLPEEVEAWRQELGLGKEKIVALLPGSRRQEIEQNLPMMLRAASKAGGDFRYVIASAPNISVDLYTHVMDTALGLGNMEFRDKLILAPCHGSKSSFMLLHSAHAALVTSGTATLETAIMGVPQVVCYAMRMGKVVSWLRKILLKVPYISLVNLIAGKEVVPELVAGGLTQEALDKSLLSVLADSDYRMKQKEGYGEMMRLLGEPGAPEKAAEKIIR